MENKTQLTSVKVNSKIWEDFKIACIKYKFSMNKLSNRALDLYLTDEEFRRKIHNHNTLEWEG